MKTRALRIWIIVALTLALGASAVRLGWGISTADHGGTISIIVFLLLAIAGSYALLLYLMIKPSLKKLRSRLVAILATVIAGGGIIGCVIHFVRFITSPRASSPLSVTVATLLLASGVVLCALILWVVWRFRRRYKD
jgi:hypothetical protein